MTINHDKIQSALKAIDVDQENLKKYFYEMILDSLSLMNQTMKDREKFGLNNDKGYSIDDLANLYLVFSSQQSKDSKMKPTTKQLKVIEFLEQQLKFWKNTNDIESPTHIGDITEFSQYLKDGFSIEEVLSIALIEILTTELYLSITEIE